MTIPRGQWILVIMTIISVMQTSHASTQTSVSSFWGLENKKSFFCDDVPRVMRTPEHKDNTLGEASSSSSSKSTASLPQQLLHQIPRGGSLANSENDENGGGFVVTKARTIIQSLLKIMDRSSPSVGQVFRSFVKTMERVVGVPLLPPPATPTKKHKTPQKKKKQSRRSSTNVEEPAQKEEKEESILSPKKKKKRSASSVTSSKPPTSAPKAAISSKRKRSSSSSSSKPSKTSTTRTTKTTKTSQAMQKHVDAKLTNKHANYRIQRELKEFLKSPPSNLQVKVGSNIRVWIVTMKGASGTIYEGETFKLRISFPKDYPVMPPSVYFLPPHLPQHEHVYTNGDICLSLLGKGWRPTMTAQSIAVSILSILSSAQTKQLPMDNARHAQNKPGQYQKDWVYHDDNC